MREIKELTELLWNKQKQVNYQKAVVATVL